MSHDATSRRVFGVTQRTIVARILRTFDRASSSDVESGARWYDEAGDLAATLAARNGYSVEQTASVIAALSPRTTWSRNVAGAILLVDDDEVLPGLIGRNVEVARDALAHGFDALNGPKTSRFARNIAGDRESVTVDVWAARVADLDENLLGRKGAYDAIEAAYRTAARARGVDPATMQATTWIVARNGRVA